MVENECFYCNDRISRPPSLPSHSPQPFRLPQKLGFDPILAARVLASADAVLAPGGASQSGRGVGIASGVGGGGFGFGFGFRGRVVGGWEGVGVGGGGLRGLGRGVWEGVGGGRGCWGVGRGRGVLDGGVAQGVAALVRVQGSGACAGRALGVVRVLLHGRDVHYHVVAVEGMRVFE